ncbi:MAG: hypothetical protein NC344_09760 [Bacteroidales bacterium]|nr:hypothetical protein [Bacteroidales bacterium]MCM1148090.1 hypothetical protein [Bacteroidales bacterium]MCM1509454.1 hypothetical protein [Clostridium sp.]
MTKQEFEQLTGTTVANDVDFEAIHAMYMLCGDGMDKQTFCKLWKEEDFFTIITAAVRANKVLMLTDDVARRELKKLRAEQFKKDIKLAELLVEKAVNYDDRDLNDKAVELVGYREVILKKLDLGTNLWDDDIEYIYDNLK